MCKNLSTALKDNHRVMIVTKSTYKGIRNWIHFQWFHVLISFIMVLYADMSRIQGKNTYQLTRNIWTKSIFRFIPQYFSKEWLHTPTLFILLVSYTIQIPSGLVPRIIDDQSLTNEFPLNFALQREPILP